MPALVEGEVIDQTTANYFLTYQNDIPKITSISVSDGITSIAKNTFNTLGYNGLIKIPNSVASIGSGAYAHNAITGITFGTEITRIEDYAFEDNNLITLNIPSYISYIGDSSFMDNELTNLTLSAGVTTIYNIAFA